MSKRKGSFIISNRRTLQLGRGPSSGSPRSSKALRMDGNGQELACRDLRPPAARQGL